MKQIAGLRNLQTVGDIYIRGDGIVSIENVGQYIDFNVQRTYDVMITDIACINDDGDGARMFREQAGVDIPEGNLWDNSRCQNCVPGVKNWISCDRNITDIL